MKPLPFSESNCVLTRPSYMLKGECGELPVHKTGIYIISRWGFSWRELLAVLLHREIWLWVLTKDTHPPLAIETYRPIWEAESK